MGTVALLLVWALCSVWRRLSTGSQCWLWRLAYLRMLVALLGISPLALPLLPPPASGIPHGAAPVARPAANPSLESPRLPQPYGLIPFVATREFRFGSSLRSGSPHNQWVQSMAVAEPSTTLYSVIRQSSRVGAIPLCILWLLGVLWSTLRVIRDCRGASYLRSTGVPLVDERIRTAYWRLCIRFGLRRGPRLLVSDEVTSPVLIGILNPIILIPRTLLEICTESDVESMLAHEIAHHCRRDLIWCWLPTLMQCLLFFHPVVWLARREWLSVQELACDELALSVTRQSPLEYGDTLLRVVALCRSAHNPFVTTASAVGTLQGFKRRIEFIRQVRVRSRARRAFAAALLLLVTPLGVLPWRMVERSFAAHPTHAPLHISSPGDDHRQKQDGDTVRRSDKLAQGNLRPEAPMVFSNSWGDAPSLKSTASAASPTSSFRSTLPGLAPNHTFVAAQVIRQIPYPDTRREPPGRRFPSHVSAIAAGPLAPSSFPGPQRLDTSTSPPAAMSPSSVGSAPEADPSAGDQPRIAVVAPALPAVGDGAFIPVSSIGGVAISKPVPDAPSLLSGSGYLATDWVMGPNMLRRTSSPGNWAPEAWGGASEFLSDDAGALRVDVDRADKSDWHAQVNCPNLHLVNGQTYALSFTARSSEPRTLGVKVELDQAPWTNAGLSGHANLSSEWRRFEFLVTVRDVPAGDTRLSFFVGQSVGSVWFSGVSLAPLQRQLILRQPAVRSAAQVLTAERPPSIQGS